MNKFFATYLSRTKYKSKAPWQDVSSCSSSSAVSGSASTAAKNTMKTPSRTRVKDAPLKSLAIVFFFCLFQSVFLIIPAGREQRFTFFPEHTDEFDPARALLHLSSGEKQRSSQRAAVAGGCLRIRREIGRGTHAHTHTHIDLSSTVYKPLHSFLCVRELSVKIRGNSVH